MWYWKVILWLDLKKIFLPEAANTWHLQSLCLGSEKYFVDIVTFISTRGKLEAWIIVIFCKALFLSLRAREEEKHCLYVFQIILVELKMWECKIKNWF